MGAMSSINNVSHRNSEFSPRFAKGSISVKARDSVDWSCHFIFVFQDTAEHSNINGKCHIAFSGEQVALEAGELGGCRIYRKEKTTQE